MKNKLTLFAAALTLASSTSLVMAQGVSDLVRMEVRVQSEQDRKENKNSSTDTVTQKKTLQIAISGKPKNPETRTGKWTIYGRDVKSKDITVLDSGEFNIELPAFGPQKVESKVVSTTYTPEHATVTRGNNRGRNTDKAKKVDAEGVKYVGYGVVVKDGDKIVGETFDPLGLKQEAAK